VRSNIIALGDRAPRLDPSSFVDPSARVMGEVSLAANTSVWAGAVLRGDDDAVTIGPGSVVLEGCIVEAPRGHPVEVAANCLVSHGAILHGCQLEEDSLVGIGAIVLDGAVVGKGTVVAAGSVVPPGSLLPPGKLVLGAPARVARDVTPEESRRVRDELARVAAKAKEYKRLFESND
jgi:carbonic anhydrase/acetyltransferase-like protein (isoleucine patch superfamily)